MSLLKESSVRFFRAYGTETVINMLYPCQNKSVCAPYRVDVRPGEYQVELWGASGGDAVSNTGVYRRGGLAGYVKAKINIEHSLSLYFFVGSRGYSDSSAAYNGGGLGPTADVNIDGVGAGGGGSTDVRLLCDDLASRVVVAGGGGGACPFSSGADGGSNLGLTGEDGKIAAPSSVESKGAEPKGGSQTGPGRGYRRPSGVRSDGMDAVGSRGGDVGSDGTRAGAGGGGFFGGGAGGWTENAVSSGAGGSSFANGCSDQSTRADLPLAYDVVMFKGNEEMVSPMSAREVGHWGDGFARITALTRPFEFPHTAKNRCFHRRGLSMLMLMLSEQFI